MTPLEISDLGHGLRLLWSQNGAYLHKGRLVVDTRQGRVMANATGGKNRGWLLPDSPEDNLKRTVAKVQAMGAAGKEKPDPCGTANPSNTRFPVIQRDVPPENLDHKPTQQQTTGRAD